MCLPRHTNNWLHAFLPPKWWPALNAHHHRHSLWLESPWELTDEQRFVIAVCKLKYPSFKSRARKGSNLNVQYKNPIVVIRENVRRWWYIRISLVRAFMEGLLGSPVPIVLVARTLNSYSTQGLKSVTVADSCFPPSSSGTERHHRNNLSSKPCKICHWN